MKTKNNWADAQGNEDCLEVYRAGGGGHQFVGNVKVVKATKQEQQSTHTGKTSNLRIPTKRPLQHTEQPVYGDDGRSKYPGRLIEPVEAAFITGERAQGQVRLPVPSAVDDKQSQAVRVDERRAMAEPRERKKRTREAVLSSEQEDAAVLGGGWRWRGRKK
ncbi:uncharacterized protein GIQ15_06612 [Arthroderma uncinatum]|uniref:uncharacterized protein n=1 Tax=Arthroderma uncinatum TaxID=74035 RepID=UPI00144AECD8|nr:uncharacterized protein GIQ15_06612 [Arthroderma uncinatum]KAF3479636.1 hypothetical protein GIQ15_06612 [Arthroderma uncinatum]